VQVKVCSRKASALEAAGDVAGAVQLYLVCLECAKVGCALAIYVWRVSHDCCRQCPFGSKLSEVV
jgi:hypothetical protein